MAMTMAETLGPASAMGVASDGDGSDLTVRKATIDDVRFVHRMLCQLEETDFSLDDLRARFCAQLASGHYTCLIAERDGVPVGMLNLDVQVRLHHARPTAEVCELIVAESVRSRGVGSALLEYALEIARRADCELCEVTTNRVRVKAHRFYERLGFEKTHWHMTMPL